MKKIFLVIGAPGSGKSTAASTVSKNNPLLTHYSTGEMLRNEAASGSELGKEISKYLSQGSLVPSNISLQAILSSIESSPTDNIIIDGYPRNIERMISLNEVILKREDIQIGCVFEIKVSEQTAKQRVFSRAKQEQGGKREDNNLKAFENRIKLYKEPLSEIKDYYTKKNIFKSINGEMSLIEVSNELEMVIEQILKTK